MGSSLLVENVAGVVMPTGQRHGKESPAYSIISINSHNVSLSMCLFFEKASKEKEANKPIETAIIIDT
jgi:hypothetical protein